MAIPSVIGPIKQKGHSLSGILSEIKGRYGVSDPISSNVVAPTSSGTEYGDISNVVLWKGNWASKSSSDSYVQLCFPNRFLFPTDYSMKSVNTGWCYPKRWDVYGFNEGEEGTPNKWDLLGQNSTSEAPFCPTTSDGCNVDTVGTFSMINKNKGYRCIRWKITEKSCSSTSRFVSAGIDVYGILSPSKSVFKSKCILSLPKHFILFPSHSILLSLCILTIK